MDWQQGMFRVTLEELEASTGRGLVEDTEGVGGSGAAGAAFVDVVLMFEFFVFGIVCSS